VPRKRPTDRVDRIADAAASVFIRHGYAGAKVAEIAGLAQVGPGTVYLYAEGKAALFDLALRRAFEDPTVWKVALPHATPEPGAVADALWSCLRNAAHFPLLWLGADSPPPDDVPAELDAILRELFTWLHRYRRGITLVNRCAMDWPDVTQVFYRRFWRGGIRRVADYLARRMGEGMLPALPDVHVAGHLVVETLTWAAVHREWTPDAAELPEAAVEATALAMLRSAFLGGS
jgi:AcrR family transcriptional regulator